jgi:prepilin-type N-terminal cleavage/methylation domain-containing protein
MRFPHKKNTSESGFTLIELLIVIFVSTIILTGFLLIYDWYQKNYAFQQAQLLVSGQARASMNEIQQYALQASEVVASQTVNGTAYSSSNTTLILKVPSINSASEPIADTYDYIVFVQVGSQLSEIVAPNAASFRPAYSKQLSDSVHALSFTFNTADFPQVNRITVSIENRRQIRTGPVKAQVEQLVLLRNR